jgi:hypothetical protein
MSMVKLTTLLYATDDIIEKYEQQNNLRGAKPQTASFSRG